MKKNRERGEKTGPKPEHLKIDGDWKDAVKKAVNTPPPKDDGDEQEADGERETEEDRNE